jgi:hypothetical protein
MATSQTSQTNSPPPATSAPVAPVAPPLSALSPILSASGAVVPAAASVLTASIAAVLASGMGTATISAMIVKRLVLAGVALAVAREIVLLAGRRAGGTVAPLGVAGSAVRALNASRRAAYIVSAVTRVMQAIRKGDSLKKAIASERRYLAQHLVAARHRSLAAQRVDQAAMVHGPTLGWYLGGPVNTHSPWCIAANGHNFSVDDPPLGRFPGTVHPSCACWAGPSFPGATSVLQATAHVKGD